MKRKVRMRKMLREEDLEELLKQVKEKEPGADGEKEAAPKPEKAATPADKVLELQKSAGNSAVGAVLERFPAQFAQRSKLPVWPEAPQMLLGGEDPVPIESVQDATVKPPTGGSGARAEQGEGEGPGEFVVHMLHGKHTAGVHQAIVEGRHYAKIELVIPGKGGKGMRWVLHDVYVSVGAISQGAQTIQLSFTRRELVFSPPAVR
jgi:hypothetical protein